MKSILLIFALFLLSKEAWTTPLSSHEAVHAPLGVIVERDTCLRYITFRAWFYAAQETRSTQRQLQAILSFWKKQSGRFQYVEADGAVYTIRFDIQAAPGSYNEEGFFMLAPDLDLRYVHQIQIVPKHVMLRMKGSQTMRSNSRIVGYTQHNFIYISADMAHYTSIGIHESGHCLGLGHHEGGIMAANLNHCRPRLTQRTINELVSVAEASKMETLH